MNPSGGFFQVIQKSCFVLGGDKGEFGGWIDCVSLCRVAFLALINVTTD